MILLMFLVAAGTALVDWIIKLLSVKYLSGTVVVIEKLLELRLTHNSGMALGFLAGNRLASLLMPLVINVVAWFLLRSYQPTRYMRTVEGLVLGGFIGNFAERLLFGSVVDMIYFPFLPWFICNVADIAICAGVALLIISLFFRPQDWREKIAEDTKNCGE